MNNCGARRRASLCCRLFSARVAAPREPGCLPCFHLNFDSLYSLRNLHVLLSDVNGTVPLSSEMGADLVGCAAAEGFQMRTFGMLFGAGGTDAAEGARMEPAVVEACMKIAMRHLRQIENAWGPAGRFPVTSPL